MLKGKDLSKYSADDLTRVLRNLNGRPRKTLEYMMSIETDIVEFSPKGQSKRRQLQRH